MGPKERRGSILTELEEAACVAVRVQTRLPLDDLFAVMREAVPRLTRSARHRALQRHGVSRLRQEPKEKGKRFKAYEIGYFHLDIAELPTAAGKAFLFVAVDSPLHFPLALLSLQVTKPASLTLSYALCLGRPYLGVWVPFRNAGQL